IALSSLLSSEEYVIQGRALPFEASDVVPLLFRTNTAGDFTVSLSDFDGLFEGDQLIYLRDNLTGLIHDLKSGEYTFSTEIGVFDARFEIIYENDTLGIENPELINSLMVATGNQQIELKSTYELIKKIQIYDVL